MRALKHWIILSILIFVISSNVYSGNLNIRTIGHETIEASGISRLSEIFTLIPEWPVSSIDRVTWQVNPNGMGTYQHSRWKIFLDGVMLELDFVGSKPLDMIPITMNQLDYVEVINSSGIYYGEFIDDGAIHIHTKKPYEDKSLSIEANLANETGDPGPYRYTEHFSPNIDRLGESIAADFSKRFNNSAFKINFKNDIHFPTDVAVRERNIALSGKHPKQTLYASSFSYNTDFNYTDINWIKSISGGYSYFENFNFNEFTKQEKYEIERFSYISIRGNLTKKHNLKYETSFQSNKTNDYQINNLTAKGSYNLSRVNYENTFGLKFNLISNASINQNNSLFNFTISNKFFRRYSNRFKQNYEISMSAVDGRLGFDINIGSKLIHLRNNYLKLNISFVNRQFNQDYQYWLYRDINSNSGQLEYFKNIKILSAQVSWFSLINKTLTLTVNNRFNFIYDYYYNYQNNLNISDGFSYSGGININLIPSEKFNINFDYNLILANSVSDELKELWNSLQKHTLQTSIRYNPVKNLSLWGRIKYTSATYWSDYEQITNQSDGKYSSNINEIFLIDITARKLLQDGKYTFAVGVRNLLNKIQRYHPLGAQFDLNYYINLKARIL